jgi:hypothetical protein
MKYQHQGMCSVMIPRDAPVNEMSKGAAGQQRPDITVFRYRPWLGENAARTMERPSKSRIYV